MSTNEFNHVLSLKRDWKSVLADWQSRESGYWDAFYKKQGFRSWNAWRSPTIIVYELADREWRQMPMQSQEVITAYPDFLTRWATFSDKRTLSRFKDIAYHPFFETNPKILGLKQSSQALDTQLIMLCDGKRFLLIEGHHRVLYVARDPTSFAMTTFRVDMAYISKKEFDRYFHAGVMLRLQKYWHRLLAKVK